MHGIAVVTAEVYVSPEEFVLLRLRGDAELKTVAPGEKILASPVEEAATRDLGFDLQIKKN